MDVAAAILTADAFSDLQPHMPMLQAAYQPYGEYMPAPVLTLLNVIDAQVGR